MIPNREAFEAARERAVKFLAGEIQVGNSWMFHHAQTHPKLRRSMEEHLQTLEFLVEAARAASFKP